MSNNSNYRISIKAIIKDKKGDILLMYNDKYGTWNLPGGGLEHGETIESCIKREINEELGLKIIKIEENPSGFITSNKGLNKEMPWIGNLFYNVELKNFNFKQSDECKEIGFFNKNTIKNINVPENVKLIFDLIFLI